MKTTIRALLLAAPVLLAACGGDDDKKSGPTLQTVIRAACEKADSCSFLGQPGVPATVSECVDVFTSCLNAESEANRNEWKNQMEDCNKISSCDAFDACYQQTPTSC